MLNIKNIILFSTISFTASISAATFDKTTNTIILEPSDIATILEFKDHQHIDVFPKNKIVDFSKNIDIKKDVSVKFSRKIEYIVEVMYKNDGVCPDNSEKCDDVIYIFTNKSKANKGYGIFLPKEMNIILP